MAAEKEAGLRTRLWEVWTDVLGIDKARGISHDSSFIDAGGDSLTALHVSIKWRRLGGPKVSANQIMLLGNVEAIAAAVSAAGPLPVSENSSGQPLNPDDFGLSPFQQFELQVNPAGSGNGFNQQSQLLRVRREITERKLSDAMRMLAAVHPILRARIRRPVDGNEVAEYRQFILGEYGDDDAFTLRVHDVTDAESAAERSPLILHTQERLDAFKGPVFGADLFRTREHSGLTTNVLSVVAHRLMVDLHSWRIIAQDLEDWLGNGKEPPPEATSFPSWLGTLHTHVKSIDVESSNLLASPPPVWADAEMAAKFWGIENKTNSIQDVLAYDFTLDAAASTKLLEWQAETGVATVDVLLGVLLFSFAAVFGQDHQPALLNGSHGREPVSADVDVSQTVGCFGSFSPISIKSQCASVWDAIQQVHEARKSSPPNSLCYFAAEFLDPNHKNHFYYNHFPAEIAFNYWGSCTKQLLKSSSWPERTRTVNGGANFSRHCLIDVQALREDGCLKFKFEYNRNMRRQHSLFKWFGQTKSTCLSLAQQVSLQQPERSLAPTAPSPPLNLGKHATSRFIEAVCLGLRDNGIDPTGGNLEDAYACPPVQQGMLVSMLNQRASIYDAHLLFRFNAAPGEIAINPNKLEEAWHKVIRKNTMLRTVFVESGDKTASPFYMGVLRDLNASDVVMHKTCTNEEGVLLDYATETKKASGNPLSCRPLACLTIYQVISRSNSSPRSVYCYLRKNHLMMDAISSMCIITQLLEGYVDKLDKEVVPYAEYVKYIERQSRNPAMDRFWAKYLRGLVPCWFPALTTLKERKAAAATPLTKTTEAITLCDTPTIQAFCRKYRLTVSNLAYAAWSLVLGRYTNQDEVCFGYPVSGRGLSVRNIDKIVGPIINMNILRTQVEPRAATTALELIQSCQKDLHDALPFQTASLPRIYGNLGMRERQPFNTIMDVQRADVRRRTFDIGVGPQIDILDMKEMDEYDLALAVSDGPENLSVRLNYSTAYLSDKQATFVMSTFGAAIRALISNSRTEASQLDLVDRSQSHQIALWNSSSPVSALPLSTATLHELVGRNVLKYPLAPALKSTGLDIDYGDLGILSHRLARWLVSRGTGPERVVTLCFEKSVWAVVAMYGVLRAGGAFSHVDPSWPKERCRDIIARTQSMVGLTSPSCRRKVSDLLVHIFAVDMDSFACLEDTLESASPGPEGEDEMPKPDLGNLAYVISTSGSTGKPKIVAIPQGSISSALKAQIEAYNLAPDSRVAQFASYVFDSSILEIFGTLIAGGCVCVPSEDERTSDFAGFVQRMGVNLLDVTPSFMRTLSPVEVPTIKILSLGGEALAQSDVDTWASHVYLINTYGPSETSVNAAISHRLLPDSDANNIGFGVGCTLWVVHPTNHHLLAPIGAVGELLVEGSILARGYLGDEAETSRAFVSDVAWQQDEILCRREVTNNGICGRLYKTGDLVRYNADGSLYFLGRSDAQVKVRGHRIERQEVEHHIRSFPGVNHVAVFEGQEGLCKGKLVAVVNLCQQDEKRATAHEEDHGSNEKGSDLWELYEPHNLPEIARIEQSVRRQLASPLPSYMIPDLLLFTRQLPLLISYKVDMKTIARAVYDMDQATFRLLSNPIVKESGTKMTTAGTELEEHLRQIWGEVLGIDKASIDLDDSFFALGGDSISAMKITRRCRQVNLQMMTHDLLAGRTIRRLASRIVDQSQLTHYLPDVALSGENNKARLNPHLCKLFSISEEDVDTIVLATPFQHQMYYASQTHPGRPYCATFLAQVTMTSAPDAHLDNQKLSQAWQSVVDRHPVLRSLFVINPQDNTLCMVVLRIAQAPIEVRHVEDEPCAVARVQEDHYAFSREASSRENNAAAGAQPDHQRLVHRLILYQTRSNALFLTLSLSHLITDTVALEHMLADLDMFYHTLTAQQQLDAAAATSFAAYANWFSPYAVTINNKAWQEKVLRGAQPCLLLQPSAAPSRGSFPPLPAGCAKEILLPFSIPSPQLQAISEFCRRTQVTNSHFFQFCWALLLKRYTRQDAACFGQLVAGRDAPVPNLEDIVGPVLSVLPAYVDLSPSSGSVLELMQSFQQANIEALAYQPCSLKAIEKSMGLPAVGGGLFNTVINIRKVHYQEKDLGQHLQQRSLHFRPIEKYDASEYDLVLQLDEENGGQKMTGALAFWAHCFDLDMANGLLKTYIAILDVVLQRPNSMVPELLSGVE